MRPLGPSLNHELQCEVQTRSCSLKQRNISLPCVNWLSRGGLDFTDRHERLEMNVVLLDPLGLD